MASQALSYERAESAFRPHEILLSVVFSLGVLVAFFALLVFAGESGLEIEAAEPPPPIARPISVKPVLDDLPLLKKGGKVKPKLPEKWKKQAPVRRLEQKAAPSTKAEKTPQAATKTPLAKPSAELPPPDAEVAKQVDQELLDDPDTKPSDTAAEEGHADGVEEGTETDPLKARAVSAYLGKILGWFNVRFRPPEPTAELPCDVLKKLSSGVAVSVGPDRRVTGYTITSPSGNAAFDERVKSTMDRVVGEELPPPPPLYPDILGSTVNPRFSGRSAQCD